MGLRYTTIFGLSGIGLFSGALALPVLYDALPSDDDAPSSEATLDVPAIQPKKRAEKRPGGKPTSGDTKELEPQPIEKRPPPQKTPAPKKPTPKPKPIPGPGKPFPLASTCGADPVAPLVDDIRFDTGRWIGLSAGAPCSDYDDSPTDDWVVTPLFGSLATPTANLPAGLERYCLVQALPGSYDSVTGYPAPPNESKIATLIDLERDGPVFAADSELSSIGFPSLRNAFLKGTGYLASPASSAPVAASSRVDIVALDTTPATPSGSLRSPHGISLYGMIDELACGNDPMCLREAKTELAMGRYYPRDGDPLYDVDQPYVSAVDTTGGGDFGTQGELARAIVSAMLKFQVASQNPNKPANRIVLNMSLGWDPATYGDFPSSLNSAADQVALLTGTSTVSVPGPVRAVHAALAHASCEGAVSVASTGNKIPGVCDGGPLLPAAFNNVERLAADQCGAAGLNAFDNDPDFPTHGATAGPLVYGVGATDWKGRVASFQRDHAVPALNALGFKGAAYVDNAGTESGILTGTSVSSAVVAASIGTAWSYFGNVAGSDLMAAIEQGAPAVKVPPGTGLQVIDYPASGAGGPLLLARSIDLCGAVSTAFQVFGGGPILCPAAEVTPPDLETTLANGIDVNNILVNEEDATPLAETACVNSCGEDYIFSEVLGGGWFNGPLLQGNFIMPQPHSNLCPSCNLGGNDPTGSGGTSGSSGTGSARIAVDSAYAQLTPGNVTIIRSGPGQPDVIIDLGAVLDPTDPTITTLVESASLLNDPNNLYDAASIVIEFEDPATGDRFNATDSLVVTE